MHGLLVFQVQTVDTVSSNVLPSLKKVGDQPGYLWKALPVTESTLSSLEVQFSMVTGLMRSPWPFQEPSSQLP